MNDGEYRFPSSPVRIVHVHIPKTAGTALSEAFRQAYGDRLRVYPEHFESRYREAEYADFDFFSGHIGFKTASEIGGDLITVLRDPVDRFISTYFFMRQMHFAGVERSEKTALAARYDLDQFARITGEDVLDEELRNRMTWQLAHSHRLDLRRELIDAGAGDDDLLRMSVDNLGRFAIVGLQTDMPALARRIERRYGVPVAVDRLNVTDHRLSKSDIPKSTLERIGSWVHLDEELWSAAQLIVGERQSQRG